MPRTETGALKIDDDWPGVFIRGDDCMAIKMSILGMCGAGDNMRPTQRLMFDQLVATLSPIMGGDFEQPAFDSLVGRQFATRVDPNGATE